MFLRLSGPASRDENVHWILELDGNLELQGAIRGVSGDAVRVDRLQCCYESNQFEIVRTHRKHLPLLTPLGSADV
jgi:hypothetical protein